MIRLLINGSKGHMGKSLVACAAEDSELEVSAEVDEGDDFSDALAGCDAVIDFTHAPATAAVAEACALAGKPLVIGTTGHTDQDRSRISACAKKIPIVFSPNFSVGVNSLFWLTQKAAEILGPGFDLEVVEMHHRLKKDSPSGTARLCVGPRCRVAILCPSEGGGEVRRPGQPQLSVVSREERDGKPP